MEHPIRVLYLIIYKIILYKICLWFWLQGDQMARFFIQSLAIYYSENLLIRVKISKVGSEFCQTPSKPSYNCPKLLNFARVTKLRQICHTARTYQGCEFNQSLMR